LGLCTQFSQSVDYGSYGVRSRPVTVVHRVDHVIPSHCLPVQQADPVFVDWKQWAYIKRKLHSLLFFVI
jgi:hypothetical protein